MLYLGIAANYASTSVLAIECAVCRHAAQRQAALEARQVELAAQAGGPEASMGSNFRELLQLRVAAVVHKVGTLLPAPFLLHTLVCFPHVHGTWVQPPQ